jgi:rubrerythrin
MATTTTPRSGAPVRTTRPTPRVDHRRLPTQGFGEATLLWACDDCGELGDVAFVPRDCPACRADATAIGFVIED